MNEPVDRRFVLKVGLVPMFSCMFPVTQRGLSVKSSTNRFKRITRRARFVLELADAEARRSGADSVTCVHLLLALMAEGNGLAAHVLEEFNLDTRETRLKLTSLDTARTRAGTPDAESEIDKFVALARREVECLGHQYVGTEHLLLALCCMPGDAAAQMFKSCGVRPREIALDVLRVLGYPEQQWLRSRECKRG